jgi:uncharacterized membrane protein
MEAYAGEWLQLLIRWVHLITGIAWIGASFYFIWLDNHLLPPSDARDAPDAVGGELSAIHGGGFYHVQKFRVAPAALPRRCTGSSGKPIRRGSPASRCSSCCTGGTPTRT